MIDYEINKEDLVLHIKPKDRLSEKDFEDLAKAIDPIIEKKGDLNGLLVESESFPGWESFGALIKHLKFIKNHHQHIKKIALVTDTFVANMAESVAAHFVKAEIKKFPKNDVASANAWIKGK